MTKKKAARTKSAEQEDDGAVATADPAEPWTPVENPAGGFMYFDHAGRVFKGFKTAEAAQEALDKHEHIDNDPTLEED